MDGRKRQIIPAELWVVATPIGNLEDLSERARWALSESSSILCEDTRRTAQLTAALGISVKLERLDAHATPGAISRVVERILEGNSMALVTDAGTPGISDPAAALVQAARIAGIKITPVPGPSAVTALLSVAGFEATAFSFYGFFPRKKGEREKALRSLSATSVGVHVWFESPERVVESLAQVASELPDAQLVAAKELTKIHESVFSGMASEVAQRVAQEVEQEGARGEWCFALQVALKQQGVEDPARLESLNWDKALRALVRAKVSTSDCAKLVSQEFAVPKNQVYEAALKLAEKN